MGDEGREMGDEGWEMGDEGREMGDEGREMGDEGREMRDEGREERKWGTRAGEMGDRGSLGGFVLDVRRLRRRRSLRFRIGLGHLGVRLSGFQGSRTNCRLLDTRRSSYRLHRAIRWHVEVSGLKLVGILRVAIMPNGSNFGLLVARRPLALATFGLDASLLLHVGGDDLGGHTSGQRSVLAAFEQARDDDFRIAPRGDANKPAVVLELALLLGAHLGLELVGDGLRAAGLAGEVDAVAGARYPPCRSAMTTLAMASVMVVQFSSSIWMWPLSV